MNCAHFRPVRDEGSRGVSGVAGYCMGSPGGEIRVPSLDEYNMYCTAKSQAGCPVQKSRQGLVSDDIGRTKPDLLPRA